MFGNATILALFVVLAVAMLAQQLCNYIQTKEIRSKYLSFYRECCETCVVGYGRARDYPTMSGCFVIIAANPDGIVEKALAMRGRTVFAKLNPAPELQGKQIFDADSEQSISGTRKERLLDKAYRKAAENVAEYLERHSVTEG